MTDQELTEYLEDPVPPLTSVEHANEGESPSLTLEPPTAGGNPLALQSMHSSHDFVRKYNNHESGSTHHRTSISHPYLHRMLYIT